MEMRFNDARNRAGSQQSRYLRHTRTLGPQNRLSRSKARPIAGVEQDQERPNATMNLQSEDAWVT